MAKEDGEIDELVRVMNPQIILIILIILWSITAFIDKLAIRTMEPIAVGFIYGALEIIILPFYYWFFKDKIVFSQFTTSGIIWSIIASLIGLLSFILYIIVLKTYEASTIMGYGLSYLGISFILCVVFLGESFTLSKVLGLLLMGVGAYFLSN